MTSRKDEMKSIVIRFFFFVLRWVTQELTNKIPNEVRLSIERKLFCVASISISKMCENNWNYVIHQISYNMGLGSHNFLFKINDITNDFNDLIIMLFSKCRDQKKEIEKRKSLRCRKKRASLVEVSKMKIANDKTVMSFSQRSKNVIFHVILLPIFFPKRYYIRLSLCDMSRHILEFWIAQLCSTSMVIRSLSSLALSFVLRSFVKCARCNKSSALPPNNVCKCIQCDHFLSNIIELFAEQTSNTVNKIIQPKWTNSVSILLVRCNT